MHDFLSLIAHHGYAVVFVVVLAEAIGLPVPAAIALLAAGAAVASGALRAPVLLLVAVIGMLIGDSLLFVLGRYMGWSLLGWLCKLSANPETCIMRSAESFYKRGKLTLVIAKFIPGINTMAPPLAGSMLMPPSFSSSWISRARCFMRWPIQAWDSCFAIFWWRSRMASRQLVVRWR